MSVVSHQPSIPHLRNTEDITLLHKVIYSGIAGAVATTCIYPLDITKTKLMNQVGTKLLGPVQMFNSLIKQEGLTGLYRGFPPAVIFVMPEKAIKLTMNDYFRNVFRASRPEHDLPLRYEVAAGASAGFCQVIATNPMELLKIQGATMNDKIKKGQLKTKISYPALISSLGVSGLYTGVFSTLARDVPFSAIYFSGYSQLKEYFSTIYPDSNHNASLSFLAGAIAGTTAAALTCPIDVIKTRVHASVQPEKLSTIDFIRREFALFRLTASDIYRNEGSKAFFKGIAPRCVIIAPLFAITMAVYESLQQALG